jgi:hypothetical protein
VAASPKCGNSFFWSRLSAMRSQAMSAILAAPPAQSYRELESLLFHRFMYRINSVSLNETAIGTPMPPS